MSENQQTRDRIIEEILALMAQYGLTWADIEEPENQQEPEVSEN
jgi:hypothetical protein